MLSSMDLATQLSAPAMFDVGLAPQSRSNLYVDFDGDIRGVFVSTYDFQRHAIGTHVDLQLHLPDGKEITVAGIVEWQRLDSCEGPGCGVQFTDVLPQARADSYAPIHGAPRAVR
ncbi:MAG: hypothetical protein ACI9KE_001950 [Polyangiales bacterium]|jgi:hypothetical protein